MSSHSDFMSPKRQPSKTPLSEPLLIKKRKLTEPVVFTHKPDEVPVDLTDKIAENEKEAWLCLLCNKALDIALVPTPCKHGQIHTKCALGFSYTHKDMRVNCHCPNSECGKDLEIFICVTAELQSEREYESRKEAEVKARSINEHEDATTPFSLRRLPSDTLSSLFGKTRIFSREERRISETTGEVETILRGGYGAWEIERHRQMDIYDAERLGLHGSESPSPFNEMPNQLSDADWLAQTNLDASLAQTDQDAAFIQSQPYYGSDASAELAGSADVEIVATKPNATVESEDEGDKVTGSDEQEGSITPLPARSRSNARSRGAKFAGSKPRGSKSTGPKPQQNLGSTEPISQKRKPKQGHPPHEGDESDRGPDPYGKEESSEPREEGSGRRMRFDPIDLDAHAPTPSPRGDTSSPTEEHEDYYDSLIDTPKPCAACDENYADYAEEEIFNASCGHHFHHGCLAARLREYQMEPSRLRSMCGVLVSKITNEVCEEDLLPMFRQMRNTAKCPYDVNPVIDGKLTVLCVDCNNPRPSGEGEVEHYFYGYCLHPHCQVCVKTMDTDRQQQPEHELGCGLCGVDLKQMLSVWSKSAFNRGRKRGATPNESVQDAALAAPTGLPEDIGIEGGTTTIEPPAPASSGSNDPIITTAAPPSDPMEILGHLAEQGLDSSEFIGGIDDLNLVAFKTGLFPQDFKALLYPNKDLGTLTKLLLKAAVGTWTKFGIEESLTALKYLQVRAPTLEANMTAKAPENTLRSPDERAVLMSSRYHRTGFCAEIDRLVRLDYLMDVNDEIEGRLASEKISDVYNRLIAGEVKALDGESIGTRQQRLEHFQRAKAQGKKLKALISGLGGREVLMLLPPEVSETRLAKDWLVGTAEMVNLLIRNDESLFGRLQRLAKICAPHFEAVRNVRADVGTSLAEIVAQAQEVRSPIYRGSFALSGLQPFAPRRLTGMDASIDHNALLSLLPQSLVSPEIISAILGTKVDEMHLNTRDELSITSLNGNTAYLHDFDTFVMSFDAQKSVAAFNTPGGVLLMPIFIPESISGSSTETWAIGTIKPGEDKCHVGIICHSSYESTALSTLKLLAESIASARGCVVDTDMILDKPATFPPATAEDHGVLLIETSLALLRKEAAPKMINIEECKSKYFEQITQEFATALGNRSPMVVLDTNAMDLEVRDREGESERGTPELPVQAKDRTGHLTAVMEKVNKAPSTMAVTTIKTEENQEVQGHPEEPA